MPNAESSHLITLCLELALSCRFPALTARGGASRVGILAPQTVRYVHCKWPLTCMFAGSAPPAVHA